MEYCSWCNNQSKFKSDNIFSKKDKVQVVIPPKYTMVDVGIKVYIEKNYLKIETKQLGEERIKINYCPHCGEKLKGD